jgi:hypothetical protein
MSTATELQEKPKRNQQAVASLVLGVLSLVLALFNLAPGLLSTLGCVGGVAALLALLAGVQGLRAVRDLDGSGRRFASAGMAAGGLGLLVFIVAFLPALQTERALERARGTFEAIQTPQVFQADGFSLTYPGDWQTLDINEQEDCKQPNVECLLLQIGHPSGDGTNINVWRFALRREATVDEADQESWAGVEATIPDVNLVSREMIEVGGQPAVRRVFNMPSSRAAEGRAHYIQTYVVKGRTFIPCQFRVKR